MKWCRATRRGAGAASPPAPAELLFTLQVPGPYMYVNCANLPSRVPHPPCSWREMAEAAEGSHGSWRCLHGLEVVGPRQAKGLHFTSTWPSDQLFMAPLSWLLSHPLWCSALVLRSLSFAIVAIASSTLTRGFGGSAGLFAPRETSPWHDAPENFETRNCQNL
ncbi:unnamed protein product [Symbiodinium natans]|uniref:Uncharacterized protein n=1 Tax=Symbiodinium natans TaxID=878477 RepID=A0A812I150_9DINO|nr:unnamed protein product [Symbiodinium natans]